MERPRIKSWGESKGRLKEYYDDWENSPSHESMKFRHRGHRKSLNENLAPLKRYLLKQVGRPWNKVYSEICQNINVTNTVQAHIRQHLPDFVALHVVLIDKKPYSRQRWRGGLHPVWEPTYVHPVTGILCKSPARKKYKYQPTTKFQQIKIDDTHKYVKIDDLWYEVEFKPITKELWARCRTFGTYPRDIVFNHSNAHEYIKEWGGDMYAVSKRSVSKKELKQIKKSA